MLTLGLRELPDSDVIATAPASGRVIITLDEDFTPPFTPTRTLSEGIISLDLTNESRPVRSVNRILDTFLRSNAPTIDLEPALVVITEQTIRIVSS